MSHKHGRTRRASQATGRGANLQKALKVTGIIGNMVLANSGIHTRKKILQKLPAILARGLKIFDSTALGRKRLTTSTFKVR